MGYTPLMFHAQVTADDKARALHSFLTEERPVIFCTSAFGMGIDRSDVRLVVHFDAPVTLVDYAQQFGRAGRDGLPATCVVFYDRRRVCKSDTQVHNSIPDVDFVEKIYHRLVRAWRKAGGALNLIAFQQMLQAQAEKNLDAPDIYKGKLQRSIAILSQVGYVRESEGKLVIKVLIRGSDRYAKLLEQTQMSQRRQEREFARLTQFFESDMPSQKLMWEIIGS
jgi:superfamily II DNA/RNA helicase